MTDSGRRLGLLVARNTGARFASQAAGRLAIVALYAVIARALGADDFGAFVLAVSVALLVTSLGGLGSDEIVVRQVARDPTELASVFWNSVAVKTLIGSCALLVTVAVGVLVLPGGAFRVTLVLVAASGLIDLVAASVYSAFQGLGDMVPEAGARTLQNGTRALAGVAVMASGGGIVALSLVYLASSVAALAYGWRLLASRAGIPRSRPTVAASTALARSGVPIALGGLFEAGLVAATTILLGTLRGSEAVGFFGVAVRLVEGTLLAGSAFVGAMVPVLAGASRVTAGAMRAPFELGIKVLTVALLPASVTLGLYADELTRLVFGSEFDDAVLAVRILSGMVFVNAVSELAGAALVAGGRQRVIPFIAGGTAILGVGLTVVLVPFYSASGAAVAVFAAAAAYAAGAAAAALRVTGPLSVPRIALTPFIGCLALGALLVASDTSWFAIPPAALLYLLVVAGLERAFYADDLRRLAALFRGSSDRSRLQEP